MALWNGGRRRLLASRREKVEQGEYSALKHLSLRIRTAAQRLDDRQAGIQPRRNSRAGDELPVPHDTLIDRK